MSLSASAGGLKSAVPFPGDEGLLSSTSPHLEDPWGAVPSAAPDPDIRNLNEGQLYSDPKDLVTNFNSGIGSLNGSVQACVPKQPPCHKVFPVMALRSASGKIPVSVLSPDEANRIFREMANDPKIPFKYPEDGCFARAHVMAQLLEKEGIRTVKSFTEGHLYVKTKNSPKGYVEWSYHVAPAVAVQGVDGKINMMVIDPSIFDHPVTVKEWTDLQTSHFHEKHKSYFTDRFNLSMVDEDTGKAPRGRAWSGVDQMLVDKTIESGMTIQKAREKGIVNAEDDQIGPPAGSDGEQSL